MTIALDPGAFAMRSLRRQRDELLSRRCRSIATSLRESDARRRWLDYARVPYLRADDDLVIPGSAATEADELFETVPRDLLFSGTVPTGDPVARQVLSVLVEGLLPWSSHRNEVCCFAQPGAPAAAAGGESPLGRRRDFFARLIHLRGYRPVALNPAAALVLAELRDTGFSGIGMALGAASCEIAVVHRGNQIAQGRLARGGRWIDEQLALHLKSVRRDAQGDMVLDVEAARRRKESLSLHAPANGESRLVAQLYKKLTGELVDVLSEMLAANPHVPLLPQPLSLICAGGPARIEGFREFLGAQIASEALPVAVTGPRLASDHEYAVSRGCLIRAELESPGAGDDWRGQETRAQPSQTRAQPSQIRAQRRRSPRQTAPAT